MNRRKKMYRNFRYGFGARRKVDVKKWIITFLCLCLIGSYSYESIKKNKLFDVISEKVSSLRSTSDITYKDISGELENISKERKNTETTKKESNKKEDVKLATINGCDIYAVQVASVDNDKDLKEIETSLINNKIPFSVIDKGNSKKVQTYFNFDEENARKHLEEIRDVYSDAFVSKMEIPMLSLEYTSNYSYIGEISNQLNKLITNFEDESNFWQKEKNTENMKDYNKILTDRKSIVEDVKKEVNKIDYSEMSSFKKNLNDYTDNLDLKISTASKAANEEKYNVSEGLLLSSIQDYFLFLNSIK